MQQVVFTGKFMIEHEHLTRDLLMEAAAAKGFDVSKRVTKQTDILVTGDTGHFGKTRKIVAAEANGTLVVDAKRFYEDFL